MTEQIGNPLMARVHLALLHWPALNRTGERVATATTNLDIHDVARLSATYRVGCYWLVQPLENQRSMVQRIVRHWVEGPGAEVHPDRSQALNSVRVVESIIDVQKQVQQPVWVATSAAPKRPTIPVMALAQQIQENPNRTFVLCFGTGWGMAPEVMAAADCVLDPITPSDYNHLSVRSAISIYTDRLWVALESLST